MTKREQELYKDLSGIIVVILLGALAWHFFGCTDISLYPVQENKDMSLSKGQPQLPNLIPVTINNPVTDLYGEKQYIGKTFVDYDSVTASVSCIIENTGDAEFVNDPSKNFHFIHIKVGHVDTTTMTITSVWEYWKDEFYPFGSCIEGLPCGFNRTGVIAPLSFDQYDERYDSMKLGYNIIMVEVNASRAYRESDYRDNEYCFGAYWVFTEWTPASGGMWNGILDDKFLTPELERQLNHWR